MRLRRRRSGSFHDLILAELGVAKTEAQQEFLGHRFVQRYVEAVDSAPWLGRGAAALKLTVATSRVVDLAWDAFPYLFAGLFSRLGTDSGA